MSTLAVKAGGSGEDNGLVFELLWRDFFRCASTPPSLLDLDSMYTPNYFLNIPECLKINCSRNFVNFQKFTFCSFF